jgi:hypothetical protein
MMMSKFSLYFFLSFMLVSGFFLKAQSAPHPLMGSSIINNPSNSIAFSQMGFRVDGIPSYWTFNKNLDSKAKILEIGPDKKTLLSFRLENVGAKTELEAYVRQYLRDYNQYGFEVSGLQSLKRNGVEFAIVDLNQKNKATKTRQLFYHNKTKMVIATCTDSTPNFESTLQLCNNILSTFSWNPTTE